MDANMDPSYNNNYLKVILISFFFFILSFMNENL